MPAFRTVVSALLCEARWEKFLYELKAGPEGGLRPPSGPATTRQHRAWGPHLHPPSARSITVRAPSFCRAAGIELNQLCVAVLART